MTKLKYENDVYFSEHAKQRLKKSYMKDDETSPQERFRFVADSFASNQEHADRMYNYASDLWVSFSTPILAYGKNKGSLGISCYLPYIEDTKESLFKKSTESRILSTLGGGVGLGMGIRPRDEKSTGVMPHAKTYDADVNAYKQGSCYVEGVEVFTDKGFVEFKNLTKSHKIAMVDENRNIHFTTEYETVEQDYDGYVCRFKSKNIDLSVTPNHRMIYSDVDYKSQGGDRIVHETLKEVRADSLNDKSALWFGTRRTENKTELSSLEKFYIALQADGCILKTTKNAICFRFKKERKKESLKNILDDLSEYVTYSLNEVKGGIFSFYVKVNDKVVLSKNLNDCFDLSKITKEKAEAIILECGYWDGSYDRRTENSITYSTSDSKNFKFYEYVATISGIGFKTTVKNREHEGRQTQYIIRFFGKSAPYTYSYTKTKEQYTGKVYCAIVPTGMLLVKSNGRTLVCGNSRRGAVAIYLDVTHPEIMEFITIRDPFGGDANRKSLNIHHGINLTDDFMQRVETLSTKELTKAEIEEIDTWMTEHPSGVKRKESVKEIYEKILETRLQTGEPYLHFIDTSNKFLPKFQKDLGLTVKQSNLCFKGDTLVWTVNGGNLTIKELAESSAGKSEFLVYSASFKNGEWVKEISKAVAFQTGVLETIKVVLSNGKYFECTPEHKIALVDGSYEQARNLVAGQELVSIGEKIFVENIEFDETFTPVYDLTVENNHNFFIKFDKFDESNNSVLVHNCSEIIEPTGTDYMGVNRTAICCLASVNISKYDEWKDNTQFVQDIVEFLDNVIQSFIDDASKIDGLEDVVHSAKMERAIGIGAMGFHDYLQQKMIAFESPMAVGLNKRIFKFIKENADIATQRLAIERGACPDYLEWVKRCNPTDEEIAQNPPVRNSQTTSVAPNACQSKSNLVKTVNDVKTVGEILLDAGVDVDGLETQNKKQWVSLASPIEIETLNGIREIEKVWYNGNDDELYELEFPDGCVYRFTGNHRLMVKTEESWDWKEVKNLTEDDDILTEEEFKLLNLKF